MLTIPNRTSARTKLCLGIVTLCALSLQSQAAEGRDTLPLGHPDFYPSPERPIGWRGDGNGAFPGAKVIHEFGDGTVKYNEIEITKKGKKKKTTLPYADKNTKPINIAWKHPLPGFSMSQPIIVGKLAIQTCEPRTILCLDMETGKELWRQELDPFKMIGLDGAKRDEALLMEDTAWVLHALSKNAIGNYSRINTKNDTPEGRKRYLDQFARMRRILEREDVKNAFPNETKNALIHVEKGERLLNDTGTPLNSSGKEISNAFREIAKSKGSFSKQFHNRYKFCATKHWYSYIGWTWPTPVCDGTWLYVYMDQGQIARVALADGSIDWFRKLVDINDDNQPLPRSPLLHDGIMIIPADRAMFGIAAETGEEVWRFDMPSQHNNSGVGPALTTLASGRTVLVAPDSNNKGKHGGKSNASVWLLDPKSGKPLTEYTHKKGNHDPGPSILAEGNYIFSGFSGFALKVTEDGDKLGFEELWTTDTHGGNVEVLHDGVLYLNDKKVKKRSLATGKGMQLSDKHSKFGLGAWKPGILVGDTIFGVTNAIKDVSPKIQGLHRISKFIPVSDLNGKLLSDENIIEVTSEHKTPHCAPQAERFLGPDLNGDHLASICAGFPDEFSYAGLYAHGNRVLITTISHLYCVGDVNTPYNGGDKP